MAKTRVVLNSAGIIEVLKSDGVASHLRECMSRVQAAAQATAAVHSGQYERSIRIYVVERSDRTVVQVGSDRTYALALEARTGNLARALDSA